MSEEYKDYLGDSVYVKFDGTNIILYLDNGIGVDTEIVLDPQVLDNFYIYINKILDMLVKQRLAKPLWKDS